MKELTLNIIKKKAAAANMTPEEYINTMDTRYSVHESGSLSGAWRKTWDTFTLDEATSRANQYSVTVITESEALQMFEKINWVTPSTKRTKIAITF